MEGNGDGVPAMKKSWADNEALSSIPALHRVLARLVQSYLLLDRPRGQIVLQSKEDALILRACGPSECLQGLFRRRRHEGEICSSGLLCARDGELAGPRRLRAHDSGLTRLSRRCARCIVIRVDLKIFGEQS